MKEQTHKFTNYLNKTNSSHTTEPVAQVTLNHQTSVAQLNTSDPEPPNISSATEVVVQLGTSD